MIYRREATMYVYLDENNTKYVDFIPTQEPCSVRDTLVKIGYADYSDVPMTQAFENLKLKIRNKLVCMGNVFAILIDLFIF